MSGLDKVLSATIASLEAENAYLRERHAEAVAQLQAWIEVTIDVFERFPDKAFFESVAASNYLPDDIHGIWYVRTAKPHLEHLKALAKEVEV